MEGEHRTTMKHDGTPITPHPEVDCLSNSELREALKDADENLELYHKLPEPDRDPILEPWLVQERRLILAELNRRNPDGNFTSDYRNPSSEVKFEWEVNAGVLQAETIAQGIPPVT
jgi:hypothetical protein